MFLLPGPPRELYPMFHAEVGPRLRALAGVATGRRRSNSSSPASAKAISTRASMPGSRRFPGLEFGYCAHIGEVDLRLIGSPRRLASASAIAAGAFADSCVERRRFVAGSHGGAASNGDRLTLATAESCTGG